PFEQLLRVVEDSGRRIEGERTVRLEPRVVPAAPLGPLDADHVVGEDLPEAGARQYPLTLGRGPGVRVELHIEAEVSGHGEDPSLDGVELFVTTKLGHRAEKNKAHGGLTGPPCALPNGSASGPGQPATRAAMSSPIWLVLRAAHAPCRSTRSSATACSIAAAASLRPRWSRSIATDRMVAVGSALPWPAMSGALPCTGSNIDGAVREGLMLPLAARPMPPAIAAPMSVRMSPKRLSVTITSNRSGWVTKNIEAASTWQ